MAHSYYEESFRLHSENARLRKRIESLEQGLEIDKLRNFYEAEIKKHINKENRLQKLQVRRVHLTALCRKNLLLRAKKLAETIHAHAEVVKNTRCVVADKDYIYIL